MFCPKYGFEIIDDSKLCFNFGNKLNGVYNEKLIKDSQILRITGLLYAVCTFYFFLKYLYIFRNCNFILNAFSRNPFSSISFQASFKFIL